MPAGTKTSAESASAEDNLDFKTICRNFEPMRGAAAGGSKRKRAFRRAAPHQGRINAGTNKAGSRRAHGLRPGSGPMQSGDRTVAHAGGRTCPQQGSDKALHLGKIEVVQHFALRREGVKLPPYGHEVRNRLRIAFGLLEPRPVDDDRRRKTAVRIAETECERSRKVVFPVDSIRQTRRHLLIKFR